MALIAKQPLKPAPAISTTSNAQRSTIYQNPAFVNTTNLAKQLGFTFNDNSEKTNIIVTTFNIEKY